MTFASIKKFIADESGATAIEYGLIAALVAVAGITAFTTLGGNVSTLFGGISGQLTTNTPTSGTSN